MIGTDCLARLLPNLLSFRAILNYHSKLAPYKNQRTSQSKAPFRSIASFVSFRLPILHISSSGLDQEQQSRKYVGHLPEAGGARAAGAPQPARRSSEAQQEPRRDPPRLPLRPPFRRLLRLLRRRRRPRLRLLHPPKDVLRAGRDLLRLHGPPGQPEQPGAAVRHLRPHHQRSPPRHRGLPHAPRQGPLPRRPGPQGPLGLLRLRPLRHQTRRHHGRRRRRVRGAEHRRRRAAALGRGGGRLRGHLRRPGRRQGRLRQVLRAVPGGLYVPQRGRAQELRAPHEPAHGDAQGGQRRDDVWSELQGGCVCQGWGEHAPRREQRQLGRRLGRVTPPSESSDLSLTRKPRLACRPRRRRQ